MRNEADQPAIRPEDVASRSFAFARKGGYEPREVQDFLRRVGEELRIAQHHAYDLEHTLTIRTEELERARNVDEAEMTRILGLETVKVLDAAREAAAQIRARAEASAAEIVEAAQQQADEIRAEAAQVLDVRRAEADAEVAGMLRKASESLSEAQVAAAAAKERAEAEGEAHLEAIRERGREMVGEAQAVRERMLRDLSRRRKALKVQIDQLQAARDRLLAAYEVVRRTTDEASGELEGMLDAARDAAQRAVEERPAPQGDPDADIIAVIEAVRAERRAEAGDRDDLLDFPDPLVDADAEAGGTDDGDTAGADPAEAGAAGSPADQAAPAEDRAEEAVEAASDDSEGSDGSTGADPEGGPTDAPVVAPAGAPSGFYDFGSEIEVDSEPTPGDGADEAASEQVDLDVDWWEQDAGRDSDETEGASSSDAGADGDASAVGSPGAAGDDEGGDARAGGSGSTGDEQADDASEPVAAAQGDGDDDTAADGAASDSGDDASDEKPPRAAAGREVVSIFARLRQEASGEADPATSSDAEGGSEGPEEQGATVDAGRDEGTGAGEAEATAGDGPGHDGSADDQVATESAHEQAAADQESTAEQAAAEETGQDDSTAGDAAATEQPVESEKPVEDAPAGKAVDDEGAAPAGEEAATDGPAGADTTAQDEDLLARRDAALGEVRTTLARRLKRTVADEQNEVLDVLRRHKGKVDLDLVFPVLEEHVERYADASLPTLAAAAAAGAEFVQKGWPDTVRPAPRTRVGDVAEELGIEVVVPLRDAVSTEIDRHGDDLDALDEAIREAYRQWKVDTPDAVAGRAASSVFHRALREQVSEGVELRWIVGDDGCSATTLESDPTAVPPVRPGCACLVVPAAPLAEAATA